MPKCVLTTNYKPTLDQLTYVKFLINTQNDKAKTILSKITFALHMIILMVPTTLCVGQRLIKVITQKGSQLIEYCTCKPLLITYIMCDTDKWLPTKKFDMMDS